MSGRRFLSDLKNSFPENRDIKIWVNSCEAVSSPSLEGFRPRDVSGLYVGVLYRLGETFQSSRDMSGFYVGVLYRLGYRT